MDHRVRRSLVESLEQRVLFNVDPIWVGGVYVEADSGSDQHGDTFYVTFRGGAPGTQLTRLVIDTDQNATGLSVADNLFDTLESGLGADHAFPFQIESITAANPNAKVSAQVADGGMQLILTFENFFAGDKLRFSIDVDEVQHYTGQGTTTDINDGLDPITSGVEFDGSRLTATFSAPRFEVATAQGEFANRYDPLLAPSQLDLPGDDTAGLRDRTAGTAATIGQIPKPISLAGTVYVDNNLNLTQESNEAGIAGVTLELFKQTNGTYVSTGFQTTTDSSGRYSFGLSLGLQPGIYQIREVQPAGYLSVGAVPGLLDGAGTLGATVPGNKDILTEINIPQGDSAGTRLDFAEAQPTQISGFVYRDNNDNGIRENGESGIGNVEIQIVSLETITGTTVSQTTRTAADGSYRFVALPPGRYRVVETTQPIDFFDGKETAGTVNGQKRGTTNTNEQISEIRLDGNESGIEFNFGEIEPSSLSGHVCVALPGFDCFSTLPNSTAPLPGVKIDLVNAAGQIVASTTTANDGSYVFTKLPAGVYSIIETQPADLLDGESRTGRINNQSVGTAVNGTRIENIALGGGQNGTDYDFCELPPASLSGHVYRDDNNDGVRQPNEALIANAIIRLLDSNNNQITQTLTDSAGFYKFSLLRPGNYRIVEVTPNGYLDGKDSVGTIQGSVVGTLATSDDITNIQLPSGMNGINYDFGELLPASIAGNVYEDADGDCIRDPNEVNLAGVQIQLLNAQGIVIATTQTDTNGNYSFTNLSPGTYTVRELQPAGYLQGGQMAGTAGGDDSVTDIISAIALGAGVNATQYDFCEQRAASLEGIVFADLNDDNIFDSNESPIAGVTIRLLDSNGNIVQSTTTNALGTYHFDNLPPGKYSVQELQPQGYFQGSQMAPPGVGNTSVADLISAINLTSGQHQPHLDFSEVPPATISGYVFQDGPALETKDGLPPAILKGLRDGIRNAGDNPIAGVTLELRLRNGKPFPANRALPGTYSGDTIRVTTDSNGYYEFRGLRPGAYHIYQTQPTGYFDGRDTAGTLGGLSINADDVIDDIGSQTLIQTLASDPSTDPRRDAILMVNLAAGNHSNENNFSEIVVKKEPGPPAPPPPQPPTTFNPPPAPGIASPPFERVLVIPPFERGRPDTPLAGYEVEYTWHLSIINAGEPRGHQANKTVSKDRVARSANVLNTTQWTIDTIANGRWTIVSANRNKVGKLSRESFDIAGAKPLAGDFNGDGRDELVLFKDGEWLLDINGNGVWDQSDLWARLGDKGDQPVVGDWDGDGKDDIGIFGPEWDGDEIALAREPGLPDPENRLPTIPKNLPPLPVAQQAARERLMQRSIHGEPRSDVIDHVFRFGKDSDQPVAGDFNGDGISTLGIFRGGDWRIDVNGDGKFSVEDDSFFEFGQDGDIAVVGDFNGDGLDEIAVVRGRDLIVDSNGNGKLDATDRVFQIEGEVGAVVVGDFDGDGIDEAAFNSSSSSQSVTNATVDAREAKKAS